MKMTKLFSIIHWLMNNKYLHKHCFYHIIDRLLIKKSHIFYFIHWSHKPTICLHFTLTYLSCIVEKRQRRAGRNVFWQHHNEVVVHRKLLDFTWFILKVFIFWRILVILNAATIFLPLRRIWVFPRSLDIKNELATAVPKKRNYSR